MGSAGAAGFQKLLDFVKSLGDLQNPSNPLTASMNEALPRWGALLGQGAISAMRDGIGPLAHQLGAAISQAMFSTDITSGTAVKTRLFCSSAEGNAGGPGLTIAQTQSSLEALGFSPQRAAQLVQYACGAIAVAGIEEAAGDARGARYWIDKAVADYGLDTKGPTGKFTQMTMEQMLRDDKFGGPITQHESIGRAGIGAHLQNSELVSIDAPKHHLLASAMDPQGRIYVGKSMMAFSGGKEWMTLQEIEALTGTIQGAYTYERNGQQIMSPSMATLGSGVSARDALVAAAQAKGLMTPELYAMLQLMANESGDWRSPGTGNPSALNPQHVYGPNGEDQGQASGLMQMLPGTFAAHAEPGHQDIWNPYDNALASINYIRSKYGEDGRPGSPLNIPNLYDHSQYKGYASGGTLWEPVVGMGASGRMYSFAETGPEPFGGVADGGSSGSITVAPEIHIHAAALTDIESMRVARQIKDHVAFELAEAMEKVSATIPRRP